MNPRLTKLFTQLDALDTWTQLSVLPAWGHIAASAAIRSATRLVPDFGGDGVEAVGHYEQAMLKARQTAGENQIPALIALHAEINTLIEAVDGEPRDLASTLEFMTNRRPDPTSFAREYDYRKSVGARPRISRKEFIEQQAAAAERAFEQLLAKGQTAVRLLETFTSDDNTATDLPEWIFDSMESKLVQKMKNRWAKLELTACNPRMPQKNKDEARGSQLLIEKVLSEYGEQPPIDMSPDVPEEEEDTATEPFPAEAGVIKPNPPVHAQRVLVPSQH